MKLEQAERFYNEHKSKFFYNRLVTFMTSGPSEAYLLAREDAIAVWRCLMGPTKVFKCQLSHPNTIRAKHGLTDTRNATHGSDSDESVRREVGIMIPQFCFEHWKQMEELTFRRGKVQFNKEQFIHFYTHGS
ncbi:Hypothetical protein CINCED_3A008904 [Cinara cedri]|nr:Hypothetical protein CINCED_3A008904 [Cinara cedri]